MSYIDLLAILLTATMTGTEFTVAALLNPTMQKLDPVTRVRSLSAMARTMGRVMPFWYALGLVLIAVEAYLRRDSLIETAGVLWLLSIILTVIFLVPINNRIAKANADRPEPGFHEEHATWDNRHRWRVVLLVVATSLLIAGILRSR